MQPTVIDDFGVIVTCSSRDLWMAKGCCASIRHFMPDAPICLLYDGRVSQAEALARTYDARILSKENVDSRVLRDNSFGYGITKMVAFWESPFGTFLLLDADTIVVGDMREHLDGSTSNVIANHAAVPTIDQVENLYFDSALVSRELPEFNWCDRRLFNTGVMIAKRGAFKLADYMRLIELSRQHPNLFKLGDQGMLNCLAFLYADAGRIKLDQRKIQVTVRYAGDWRIDEALSLGTDTAVKRCEKAVVLHYAGARPYSAMIEPYVKPMTYFRELHRRDRRKALGHHHLTLDMEEYFLRHPRTRKLVHPLVRNRM